MGVGWLVQLVGWSVGCHTRQLVVERVGCSSLGFSRGPILFNNGFRSQSYRLYGSVTDFFAGENYSECCLKKGWLCLTVVKVFMYDS
jgi:hypothetical protein